MEHDIKTHASPSFSCNSRNSMWWRDKGKKAFTTYLQYTCSWLKHFSRLFMGWCMAMQPNPTTKQQQQKKNEHKNFGMAKRAEWVNEYKKETSFLICNCSSQRLHYHRFTLYYRMPYMRYIRIKLFAESAFIHRMNFSAVLSNHTHLWFMNCCSMHNFTKTFSQPNHSSAFIISGENCKLTLSQMDADAA